MMYRTAIAAIVSIAAFSVYGQVEVVDRSVPSSKPQASAPAVSSDATAKLYFQLQVLQQEVQELRGLVEEQNFELKKLKQQRLDDYLDLDRRLGQLANGAPASSASSGASASTNTSSSLSAAGPEEMKKYKAAMNLVLREQKYDEAIVALEQQLEEYPNGRFASNSQYWLGEVYLQKNELESARQWFARVLSEFPKSGKAPDAKYKLGIVHFKLGDKPKAKGLLEEVAQSKANAARLAREFLSTNYP